MMFPLRKVASRSEIVVIMNDIRWVSFMALLFGRRNYKTVLWGQGIPNRRNRVTIKVRKIIANFSDSLLFYDEKRKAEFCLHSGLSQRSFVAANTLVVNNHGRSEEYRNTILFVGRMNKEKRPVDLLEAFCKIPETYRSNIKLLFVGDGQEKERLLTMIAKTKSCDIEVLSACYDEKELQKLYARAIVSVIPGTVGLGIVHAFAYGVPLLCSPDRKHGPEFSYASKDNAFFYTSNDTLTEQLIHIIRNPQEVRTKGQHAYSTFKESLGGERWLAGFWDACNAATIGR